MAWGETGQLLKLMVPVLAFFLPGQGPWLFFLSPSSHIQSSWRSQSRRNVATPKRFSRVVTLLWPVSSMTHFILHLLPSLSMFSVINIWSAEVKACHLYLSMKFHEHYLCSASKIRIISNINTCLRFWKLGTLSAKFIIFWILLLSSILKWQLSTSKGLTVSLKSTV